MIELNRHRTWHRHRAARANLVCTFSFAALFTLFGATAQAQCVGDCDGDGMVGINELIVGVNISLGTAELSSCLAFDAGGDGGVEINELIIAVNNALTGCPRPADTPTATASATLPPATATVTGSATATQVAATATATASGTQPPLDTPTGTPTGTATATQPPLDTPTGTPAGTATATVTAPQATATNTSAGDTPTATATGGAVDTPSATPTATMPATTATFTPTATPTTGAVCGNHVLEADETCQDCAADCQVQACTPSATTAAFLFELSAPPGQSPTDATVRIGYRSDLLSIPGMASEASVLSRIVAPPPAPVPFIRNDQNYAVAITLGRTMPITELFTITFDRCNGAPAPTVADLGCAILGCAAGGPPIDGCTCEVHGL